MPSVFTLWGELKADTKAFERSMYDSDVALNTLNKSIEDTEQKAKQIGDTSATTARKFEKLTDAVKQQRQRLDDAAQAYLKGDINARRFASIVGQTENKVAQLNSRLKDSSAQLSDWARRSTIAGSAFKGALGAIGVSNFASIARDFAVDSAQLFATFDKLTRFTATLDRNFQSPAALLKFQEDIKQLSTEIPHSAESIARASFTIKSAFQNITEPELINFLREFGNAATASNTDIASHAQNLAALAKQYNITGADLGKFSALIASAFGQALASDAQVAAGFNQVINAARSTRQPLADMVAAMSTLQSASNDAAGNTTLLQNVFAKLTDPKYIAGMKAMGVSAFDTSGQFRPLNDIVNDLANKLKGLNDQQINDKLAWAKDLQAREGLKTLIRQVGDYNKILADGADEDAFQRKNELMLNSAEAKWEKFTNKVNSLKIGLGAGLVDFTEDTQKAFKIPPPKLDAAQWADVIGKGLALAVHGGGIFATPVAAASGNDIGLAMTSGLKIGLADGQSGVVAAAVDLAYSAYRAAKSALDIKSPSKVFFALGKDTAQGFIDGINALKTTVHGAMASLLDVSQIKGLGKKDAPGVELLTQLSNELANLTPRTKAQETAAELTAGKYAKLNAAVRERIDLAAKEIDHINAVSAGMDKLSSLFDELIRVDKTALQELNEALAGREAQAALDAMNPKLRSYYETFLRIAALQKDVGSFGEIGGIVPTGTGGTGTNPFAHDAEGNLLTPELTDTTIPPPPRKPWEDFWGMMNQRLLEWRGQLPSIKTAIGENLLASIQDIGNVFANAVQRWDGTAKGFFLAVAQGFKQMAQNIIGDLVRIAFQALITKALTAAFGGLGGGDVGFTGGQGTPVGAGGVLGLIGLAGGGQVRGSGGPRSDSVLARLSPKEFVEPFAAVQKYGLGMMESIRNLTFPGPQMAFASGGYYGGAGYTPTHAPQTGSGERAGQTVINQNFHFHANANGNFSKESTDQAVKKMIAAQNRVARHDNGF
jgi:TP901 family phage tail tape measure protein